MLWASLGRVRVGFVGGGGGLSYRYHTLTPLPPHPALNPTLSENDRLHGIPATSSTSLHLPPAPRPTLALIPSQIDRLRGVPVIPTPARHPQIPYPLPRLPPTPRPQIDRLRGLPVISHLLDIPIVHSLLLGVLPGLALRLFILLLPLLLYPLNRAAGAVSEADVDFQV